MVCDVAEDLVEKLRKFRFRKETNNAAIISKLKVIVSDAWCSFFCLFVSLAILNKVNL